MKDFNTKVIKIGKTKKNLKKSKNDLKIFRIHRSLVYLPKKLNLLS